MKKALSIALIIQFLIPTIGVAVFEHHCYGMEQTSRSIIPPADCCCSNHTHDCTDCCETELEFKKIDHNYQPPTVLFDFEDWIPLSRSFVSLESLTDVDNEQLLPFWDNFSPPHHLKEDQPFLQVFIE